MSVTNSYFHSLHGKSVRNTSQIAFHTLDGSVSVVTPQIYAICGCCVTVCLLPVSEFAAMSFTAACGAWVQLPAPRHSLFP